MEDNFTKGYVLKANTRIFQIFPTPDDLENWHEVPLDKDFDYSQKIYDPETGKWNDDDAYRMTAIKAKARQIIYDKYDQEDQNNLAYLPPNDAVKIAAVEWINKIRAISKKAIAAGTLLTDVDWQC